MSGLITQSILKRACQRAVDSGFKVGDKIQLKATHMIGTIVYNYNYIGEFGIKRESGKYKGSIAYWSANEFKLRD